MMTLFSFSSHKGEEEAAPNDFRKKKKTTPKKGRRLWSSSAQKHEKLADSDGQASSSSSLAEPPSLSPVKIALSEDTASAFGGEIGIEISLDWDAQEESAEEEETPGKLDLVLNLDRQMRRRNKVHRSQFSVSFPVLDRQDQEPPMAPSPEPLRRGHRIPLWETTEKESYEGDLRLLQNYKVKDEVHAVKDEIVRLTEEIEALAEDQRDLEQGRSPKINLTKKVCQWDIHEWLALGGDSISRQEREILEDRRGLCLTLHLHDKKARDSFVTSCHWDGSSSTNLVGKNDIISLGPPNCNSGGAAESIRHLCIMSGHEENEGAYFYSRDRDRSSTYGQLPERLAQKLKGAGLDARHDLLYLSTGPQGCYYAEFRSGHVWWGNALGRDTDFSDAIQKMSVYRVAFGPIVTYEDDKGLRWTTNSWMILGRDGRAAWKNLPSRLHQKLESRLADWPAPAEVTLGSDDSYFIRFLDGTIDYCLPAEVASVCDFIESRGGRITDMSLHPEVSQDFVIRHTQI